MKPSIPKGTRDFGPLDVQKRNYLFSIIKEVFIRFGYQQIETPTLENLSTLTGKYGEEGDKLLFKVLTNVTGEENTPAKRGLRYDLTVPFARFVVQHQNLYGVLTGLKKADIRNFISVMPILWVPLL